MVVEEIARIDSKGLITIDGKHHPVDAIICATGFDTSFKPAFPVIGRNGRNLAEYWNVEPLHYMSIAAPGFPNYFSENSSFHQIVLSSDSIVIGGPNSPIANGSLISGIEVEIDYAYTCAEKIQSENIASIDVKEEAMRDFIQHRNEAMQAFVWSGNCRSWYVPLPSNCDPCSACSRNFCNRYKNGKIDGPVIGPWVGSSWHFNEALEKPRFEDYEIEYLRKNRFAYLGYGRTLKEELGESTAEHLTEDGISC